MKGRFLIEERDESGDDDAIRRQANNDYRAYTR